MYRKRNKQIFVEKIISNSLSRKSRFFRRNLHVNHESTSCKVVVLKNVEDIRTQINGFTELPEDVCYLLRNQYKKTLPSFRWEDAEVVVTNAKDNKIKKIFLKYEPNIRLEDGEFYNLWIIKKNTTDFYLLKIGDTFYTR